MMSLATKVAIWVRFQYNSSVKHWTVIVLENSLLEMPLLIYDLSLSLSEVALKVFYFPSTKFMVYLRKQRTAVKNKKQ